MNNMQYNPFHSSFEQAKEFDKYSNLILWISTSIIIASFVLKSIFADLQNISDIVSNINCFFIISYAICCFIAEYIFYNASIQRRTDFVDNSFGTSLAEERSKDYYTNEFIATGIYKMAVNGFENSLFTFHIAKSMIRPLWLKNILFAILVILFSIFGFNNALVLLIQLTLPIFLLQQAIKHTLFVNRINRVYENYRRLFNDLKGQNDSKQKRPEIFLNVIDYETTLTYGSILLNTKIYNRMNPKLSEKWEELKKEYEIK